MTKAWDQDQQQMKMWDEQGQEELFEWCPPHTEHEQEVQEASKLNAGAVVKKFAVLEQEWQGGAIFVLECQLWHDFEVQQSFLGRIAMKIRGARNHPPQKKIERSYQRVVVVMDMAVWVGEQRTWQR